MPVIDNRWQHVERAKLVALIWRGMQCAPEAEATLLAVVLERACDKLDAYHLEHGPCPLGTACHEHLPRTP